MDTTVVASDSTQDSHNQQLSPASSAQSKQTWPLSLYSSHAHSRRRRSHLMAARKGSVIAAAKAAETQSKGAVFAAAKALQTQGKDNVSPCPAPPVRRTARVRCHRRGV